MRSHESNAPNPIKCLCPGHARPSGDWRFLDLVPKRAGKLQALDYVRQVRGHRRGRTSHAAMHCALALKAP
jgi:hypothetical protein